MNEKARCTVQSIQNEPAAAKVHRQLHCLVLGIPILLSFLYSKLSNKVIFPQPALLHTLVIFENDMLFRKINLVICHLKVILSKNESSDMYIIIWLQSPVVLSNQYTLMPIVSLRLPRPHPTAAYFINTTISSESFWKPG
jgi:hypothetical protein